MRQIIPLKKRPVVMWVSNDTPGEHVCMAFICALLVNGLKSWAIAENRRIYRYYEEVIPSHINEFTKDLYESRCSE